MEVDKIVENLLKNNNPPSYATMDKIKRRLDGPVRDIVDIDAEIHNLEQRLNGLRALRAQREAGLERYRTVLAPMRRVPLDVLGEIFYRCLTTHRNPIMNANECPLLLTRVCSTWRAAAISDPRLWARLHVTFSEGQDVGAEGYPNEIPPILYTGNSPPQRQRQVPHALRLKCDSVKEWLSRSGDLPFSMSILYTAHFKQGEVLGASSGRTGVACDIAHDFLKVVAALAPRFEDLELQMPIEVYRELEGMMDVSKMKRLTSIRYLMQLSTGLPAAQDTNSMLLLETPNLRKVSICTFSFRTWGVLDSTNSYVRWSQFTEISFHSPLSFDEITFLLEHSRNLVHFKAIMVPHTGTVGSIPVALISYEGHIGLPSLLSLSLFDNCDPRSTERLYDRIDAPLLNQVMYFNNFYPVTTTDDLPLPPILNLLRRSTRLKKLAFNSPPSMLREGISSVLRQVPSVTHLLVGPDVRSQDGSLERHPSTVLSLRRRGAGLPMGLPPLDLGGLISVKSDNIKIEYGPPLLPNLESFEVSSPDVYLNDQDLIKFITSRMRHFSSPLYSRIANLKRVVIVFYHPKQNDLDIVAEVRRHAELVGVDMIDLSLHYPKVIEKGVNPSAPDYGLVSTTGRSWLHTDAGEYDNWV